MNRWLDLRRFLWEEETAPPEEAPRGHHEEPSGVPRPLRAATRFALIGVATTTLMSQVVGIRLVSPVDAAASYTARCIQDQCKGLTGAARAACNRTCQRNG
jgi:hypothetical protein